MLGSQNWQTEKLTYFEWDEYLAYSLSRGVDSTMRDKTKYFFRFVLFYTPVLPAPTSNVCVSVHARVSYLLLLRYILWILLAPGKSKPINDSAAIVKLTKKKTLARNKDRERCDGYASWKPKSSKTKVWLYNNFCYPLEKHEIRWAHQGNSTIPTKAPACQPLSVISITLYVQPNLELYTSGNVSLLKYSYT